VDGSRVPRACDQSAVVGGPHLRHRDDGTRVLDRGPVFISKAYVLLVFAGIWALIQGVNDIVLAFVVRGLHKALA
jgi:hypothetical protein